MPESSDNLRSALRDMKSAATGAAANINGNTLIVTNAPAGTRAAARLLAGTSAERPCGALLLGGAPVPDGIETFRADARCTGHNLATLRAATRWLRAGGVLVILRGPAGSAPLRSRVADARWGELVRRLAAWSEATVVPACVNAPGSRLQRWSRRLLPHSVTRTPPSVPVYLGDALPLHKLSSFEESFEVSRYLRLRIGLLGACAQGCGPGKPHAGHERRTITQGPPGEILARGAREPGVCLSVSRGCVVKRRSEKLSQRRRAAKNAKS